MRLYRKVLVAEDDVVSQQILFKILNQAGYSITLAKNGKEALSLFEKEIYPVVITDLRMPEMDGQELIAHLAKRENPPMVLVESAVSELNQVIEIMKMGAYDYIIKPIDEAEFLRKVNQAFEQAEWRYTQKILEKERQALLENQLSHYYAIEKILSKHRDRQIHELFANLRTTFSQGAGFGGLLSLISLISLNAKKVDDRYCIDQELMSLILENAKMGQVALDFFAELEKISKEEMALESLDLEAFAQYIGKELEKVRDLEKIKNTPVQLAIAEHLPKNKFLRINREHFSEAIRELLINAMKFSPENSPIWITVECTSRFLYLSILNVPIGGQTDGIPEAYLRLIFEPFFRLSQTVDDRYKTLDFGLGLSLVDEIIRKHGGRIRAKNIYDYLGLGEGKKIRVLMEIELELS